MSVEADKKALAGYRLEQAGESLDEANFLLFWQKEPSIHNQQGILRDVLCDLGVADL